MFRIDKKAFKKQSFRSADNQKEYWLNKTVEERFAAAMYLQSVAYGFDLNNPPKMDRTVFSKGKLDER